MVGMGLRKYGEELGLMHSNGVLYGESDGYLITLSEGPGYKTLGINAVLPQEERASLNQFVQENQKTYRIYGPCITDTTIAISFQDTIGTMKRIRRFLPLLLQELHGHSALGAQTCSLCGQTLLGQPAKVALVNGIAVQAHEGCMEKLHRDAQDHQVGHEQIQKNYGRGALGAFLGALVGAIPWVIVYLWGFFVGWLGFLIGWCAKKGYELLGGKVGRAKVWIVAVFSVGIVLLAQFVSYVIAVWQACNDMGLTLEILPLIPYTIELIFTEPDVTLEFLGNLVIGLLFAGLGLFGVVRELRAEVKEIQPQIKTLDR